jgi:ferredoxin--NADP+ reductase
MRDEFFIKPKEYDTSHPYSAIVKDSKRITPDGAHDEVRHIVLEVPAASFVYVEGQSVAVLVPGPHPFGNDDHVRMYSIASSRKGEAGHSAELSICVRRCFYIDEVSGERYPGICSNFLCDARVGDTIRIAGPYGRHFIVPRDKTANLLMVGTGTGVAPFRAFIKHIFEEEEGGWQGKIRLFYGAKTGLDLLYMNDVNDDISHYYDESTFKAFEALSPRPAFDAPADLERKLEENGEELWDLLQDPKTHVYIAGLRKSSESFDAAMSHIAGSKETWLRKKRQLYVEDRWAEHLYDV